MNFSVLLSIYHKEKKEYFDRCMQSIWDEQSVKPTEIILVKDGPLNADLDFSIAAWQAKIDCLKVVPIESNVGLGEALNLGLKHCHYDLVARMDTDDIAKPLRFEKQLGVFRNSNVDICSSWVGEFSDDEKNIISYRKLPSSHAEIAKYIKLRNPINHPAIMFRKEVIRKAGDYQHMIGFEDYYLWARAMNIGANFYNIPEVLLDMRAGYAQLERRGGFSYALNEIKLQNALLELKVINVFEYTRNVILRFITRIIPKTLLKQVYKFLRS